MQRGADSIMSKLLSRAKISLEHAQADYSKITQNDCYLDSCCFHLQQSIEFILKGIVEMNGAQFAENHDIRANLNILNRLNIDIPCEKELRTFASTLYSWESESRYKDSFIAAVKDIDEIFVIAQTLIGYITSKIEPIDVEEVEFPEGRL